MYVYLCTPPGPRGHATHIVGSGFLVRRRDTDPGERLPHARPRTLSHQRRALLYYIKTKLIWSSSSTVYARPPARAPLAPALPPAPLREGSDGDRTPRTRSELSVLSAFSSAAVLAGQLVRDKYDDV